MAESLHSVELGSRQWLASLRQRVDADEFTFDELMAMVTAVEATSAKHQSRILVNHLINLRMDSSSVLAGLWFYAARDGEMDLGDLKDADARMLVEALIRMTPADGIASSSAPLQNRQLRTQLENARKMLVALIDDPRVAVLKLAERAVALEGARNLSEEECVRIAQEAIKFYCPLASRLGIWQLKWIMEDLSFRYLHPAEYREIASRLDGRRAERERLVEAVTKDLEWRLEQRGITADVRGRAKNLFGIWRKMRAKNISFNDVYDVQAVRVVVDTVAECYEVLGVVHTAWPHIANELDDYIASPKSNGYRSIHTAVLGPQGRILEVQIRTKVMHVDSELGVCAHWSYKEEIDESLKSEKVDWLREILHWHDDVHREIDFFDFSDRTDTAERIYVTTPRGHVVDLPLGATAVDFAYRIHTEIGNRCIGAKANGKDFPLNEPLVTGQSIEIETSEDTTPSRTWLDSGMGYVGTARAKEKIQAWFRMQKRESNVQAGYEWIEEEVDRLGLSISPAELAARHGYPKPEELYNEVAMGNILVRDLLIEGPRSDSRKDGLALDAPLSIAKSLQTINIYAHDRTGLLRDVADTLARMNINVISSTTNVPGATEAAIITVELRVASLIELARIIERLRRIHHVMNVKVRN